LDRCGEDTKKKYPTAKSIALDDLYVNIDPLEYFVQQLREKWGDLAFFFYDKYGGYHIGILWKPGTTRTFSLSHMPFRKPGRIDRHTYTYIYIYMDRYNTIYFHRNRRTIVASQL